MWLRTNIVTNIPNLQTNIQNTFFQKQIDIEDILLLGLIFFLAQETI